MNLASVDLVLAILERLFSYRWREGGLDIDSFIGGAWSIKIEIVLYAIFFILRKRSWVLILLTAIAVNLAGIAL